MSELRRDPIVNRWVIISAERAARPMPPWPAPAAPDESFCPFCEGNEHSTPPEIMALRPHGSAPNGPGWSLRVVPNKFPALTLQGAPAPEDHGPYHRMEGAGAHEVIIETPDHRATLGAMDAGRVTDMLRAARERFRALAADSRLVCAQFFKNHGREAGASLPHPHAQIIAMPVVSRRLIEETCAARERFRETGSCVLCHVVAHELAHGERVIFQTRHFIALAPYAARTPFETWILPLGHRARFERETDEALADLGAALSRVARAIGAALDSPPYNLILMSLPFREGGEESYHWRLEFLPVTNRLAGFEWGAGFHINTTPPEEAAARMRENS